MLLLANPCLHLGALPLPAGCNSCFRVSENLGGKEVFECEWCAAPSLPRDLNGAVGIFARRFITTVDPALLKITKATTINTAART